MKIVIPMKQIADPQIIEFDMLNNSLCSKYWIANSIDFNALEEGLRLKEKYGGEVIAISVSPSSAEGILRKTLILGADRAILLGDDRIIGTADTWLISGLISEISASVGFDLIICGSESLDCRSRFMGAALAERLNLPLVVNVIGIELQNDGRLKVEKKLEKGQRETYSVPAPAIVTVDPSINDPRYVAPYSQKYREGIKKEVEMIKLDIDSLDLSPFVSPVEIVQPRPRTKIGLSSHGQHKSKKEIFKGPPEKGAQKIVGILKEIL